MSPNQQLQQYLSGFTQGAGFLGYLDAADEDWKRGWKDGRAAWKTASEAERVRLGMPPSQIIRPMSERSKTPPLGFEPCGEPDETTGHHPGWIPVGDEPDSKWILEARNNSQEGLSDGTYEAIGPKIGKNADGATEHKLVRHGALTYIELGERRGWTFETIRAFLETTPHEGIVFHHPDGRMAKIRRKDFGFDWPVKR